MNLIKCPSCGAENSFSFKFCSQCGSPLHEVFEETERRRVTCFFADLAGFTKLSTILEPEELKNLLDNVFEEIVSIIEENGGHIDKFLGDAVLAVFGAPFAVKERAKRALESALLINEKKFESEHEIKFHIGIATGEVVYGKVGAKDEKTILGDAVNFASRLEDLSAPGEILLDEETYEETKDLFDFEFLGEKEIRGKGIKKVYKLKGKKKFHIEKTEFPFINRQEELNFLEKFLEKKGKILILYGKQGIGKTFLIKKLVERNNKNYIVIDGKARSKKPLGLVEEIIQKLDIKEKIPSQQDTRILEEFLISNINEIFENKEVVLIIDNVDESDIDSIYVLKNVIEKTFLKYIFIIREENLENIRKIFNNSILIEVYPLKKEDFEELCFKIGIKDTLFINELFEKFKGNPLHLKLFIDYSLSKGAFKKEGDEIIIKSEIKKEFVTPTIKDLNLYKYDLLPPIEKWILKRFSCFGYKFDPQVAEKVLNIDVKEHIENLINKKILEKENGLIKFYDYSFFESVYSVLSKRIKEEIHRKICGYYLNNIRKDPEFYSKLSWHFYEAGNEEKGDEYSIKAAKLYTQKGALYKAFEIYYEILKKGKELKELLKEFFEIAYRIGEYEKIEEIYQKFQIKDKKIFPFYLKFKALSQKEKGNIEEGIRILEEFLRKEEIEKEIESEIYLTLAQLSFFHKNFEKAINYSRTAREKSKDLKIILNSLLVEANINSINFEFEKAKEVYEKALKIAEKLNEKYLIASILINSTHTYLSLGELQEAYEAALRAISISKEIGARGLENSAYIALARTLLYLYSYKEAESYLLKALQISKFLQRASSFLNASLNLIYTYRKLKYKEKFYEIFEIAREKVELNRLYKDIFEVEKLLLEEEFEKAITKINKLPPWDRDNYLMDLCVELHFKKRNKEEIKKILSNINPSNLDLFVRFIYKGLYFFYLKDEKAKEEAKSIFLQILKNIKDKSLLKNFLEEKYVKWFIREFVKEL